MTARLDDMARWWVYSAFFFQAEDGIRDLVRSRGLGDVYKRQVQVTAHAGAPLVVDWALVNRSQIRTTVQSPVPLDLSLIHI